MIVNVKISCYLISICALIVVSSTHNVAKDFGKGFHNQSKCLYSYMEGGFFKMTTAYGDSISEPLNLDSLTYDTSRTKCTEDNEHGKLVFSFKLDESTKLKSIVISMKVQPSLSEWTWSVAHVNLTVIRDTNKKRTFKLQPEDMYASLSHSYSCSELVMRTIVEKKPDNETGRIEPRAELTLNRFQLQPFSESAKYVFKPSYDCSKWVSLAGVSGFILIMFMAFFTILFVYLLKQIQPNDFKYNKEGQLFTQAQMELNKHQ